MTLQEYSNVYGITSVTAAGQGWVSERVAHFDIIAILNTTGEARLQLSDDKMLLIGEYKDHVTGITTYWRLSKSSNDEDE